MKRSALLLITLFCLNISYSQSINRLETDKKGKEKLIGKINRDGLEKNSFKNWFSKNHTSYIANEKLIKTIKNDLNQYEIKVFLGTWCGDSKREVPRFYKVLDESKFPKTQLEVIALDNSPKAYKQSPTGEEKGLNIHRVPTFIFYKNGKEVNRIVEYPKETFERDIAKINAGKYTPHYMAANYLDYLISEKTIDSLKLLESELIPRFAEFTKGSRELNTLGYINLRAKNTNEALYIFDLNTKIFPYKYNVYDSLGEAHFENENYTEALKNYRIVLSIKPDDKNATEVIEKIKTIMN